MNYAHLKLFIENYPGMLTLCSEGTMSEKNFFKELDHTADLCVEIYGRDKHDLFQNAVNTLYILLNLEPFLDFLDKEDIFTAGDLTVHGQDPEDVLIRLLGELLYRVSEDNVLLLTDDILLINNRSGGEGWTVKASGRWRVIAEEEAKGKREIKAVTYHDVSIRPISEGFTVRVVMDL